MSINAKKQSPRNHVYEVLQRPQRQTSNTGVLLELGAVPLMFYGVKNCLKNWHRIHKKSEANSVVLKIHQMASELNLPWPLINKNKLDSVGISPESEIENIHKRVLKKLEENFHQQSFDEISSEHSKLRTYVLLPLLMSTLLKNISRAGAPAAATQARAAAFFWPPATIFVYTHNFILVNYAQIRWTSQQVVDDKRMSALLLAPTRRMSGVIESLLAEPLSANSSVKSLPSAPKPAPMPTKKVF